jgi:hypothetical protein
MNKVTFTSAAVKAFKIEPHESDDVWIWDSEQKGLGIRMRRDKDGHTNKHWYVSYRFGGRDRRQALADFASYKLADARFAAYLVARAIEADIDPRDKSPVQLTREIWPPSTNNQNATERIERDSLYA